MTSSPYQFGFKEKHSTTQCTFIAEEVINYYVSHDSSVYCVLLDASKAFYRVHFVKLFNVLLEKGICPVVCRLLAFIYTHQNCSVRWGSAISSSFPIKNGVKQGGVLSPLLFSLYTDTLLHNLSESGVGCYIGNTFMGAFAYADDIALLSPSLTGMKRMLTICEEFSIQYDIIFNATKSKLIVYNTSSENLNPLFMNESMIPLSECEKHLGCCIGKNCMSKRIDKLICEMYSNVNKLMINFHKCSIDVKYTLFKSFCMPLYGASLLNYDSKDVNRLLTAWRKCMRRILNVSTLTHCNLIHKIVRDVPVDFTLHKRLLKFISMCLNNKLSVLALKVAVSGSQSAMCKSINFICETYSVCKYSLLDRLVHIYYNDTLHTHISGAIREFLELRHQSGNHDDIANITEILKYLCEC